MRAILLVFFNDNKELMTFKLTKENQAEVQSLVNQKLNTNLDFKKGDVVYLFSNIGFKRKPLKKYMALYFDVEFTSDPLKANKFILGGTSVIRENSDYKCKMVNITDYYSTSIGTSKYSNISDALYRIEHKLYETQGTLQEYSVSSTADVTSRLVEFTKEA